MVRSLVENVLNAIYPRICVGCNEESPIPGDIFCTYCMREVVICEDYRSIDNFFTRHFWGRLKLNGGISAFLYTKEGVISKAIHRIKYSQDENGGKVLGGYLGKVLQKTSWIENVEVIIPVPIHKKKYYRRGYNQSALIAAPVARDLGIWMNNDILKKTAGRTSQTKKFSRAQRHKNLQTSFKVNGATKIKGKGVLLIDDVLTTGATLEACGNKLLDAGIGKLYLATLARGGVV